MAFLLITRVIIYKNNNRFADLLQGLSAGGKKVYRKDIRGKAGEGLKAGIS
jgi:hypothetical protein